MLSSLNSKISANSSAQTLQKSSFKGVDTTFKTLAGIKKTPVNKGAPDTFELLSQLKNKLPGAKFNQKGLPRVILPKSTAFTETLTMDEKAQAITYTKSIPDNGIIIDRRIAPESEKEKGLFNEVSKLIRTVLKGPH